MLLHTLFALSRAARFTAPALLAVLLGAAGARAQCLSWSQYTGAAPPARTQHAAAYDTARSRLVVFGGYGAGILGDTWEWTGSAWSQRATSGPPVRGETAMCFDSIRNRTVLFGGFGASGNLADTWEWNGTAWSQRTTAASPPARRAHAMAFDPSRGRVVLFGGFSTANLGDTWEYDGTNWVQVVATGPAIRSGHSMTYDPTTLRVLLTGGVSAETTVWQWNGTAWTSTAPASAPPARIRTALAAATGTSRAWLFGGYEFAGPTISSQLWELTSTGWSTRSIGSPGPRQAGSLTLAGTSLVLFGGQDQSGSPLSETWLLTPGAGNPPAFSVQPTGRAISAGQNFTLGATVIGTTPLTFRWQREGIDLADGGGITGSGSPSLTVTGAAVTAAGRYRLRAANTCGSVFSNEVSVSVGDCPVVWGQRPVPSAGAARDVAAVSFDPGRSRFVVFAGASAQFSDYQKDVLEWDGFSWRQPAVQGPESRAVPAMDYLPSLGKIVMYGGVNFTQARLADTWLWNGIAWNQLNITGPPARSGHSLVCDTTRNRIVVYGGDGVSALLGDTWEFDGSAWSQRLITSPPPRSAAGIAFDSARGVVVLHGGLTGGSLFVNETWEYNGTAWTLRTGVGGPQRARHSMAYDPVRQRVVLFGGRSVNNGADLGDTWEYDGVNWQQRTPATGSPPLRRYGAMHFNPISGKLLMFGGRSGNATAAGYFDDTWELGAGPTITSTPQPLTVNAGATALFSVAAASALPLNYQWFKDGSPLADGGLISGATAATLTLSNTPVAFAGLYSVSVSAPAACGSLSIPARLTVTSSACAAADIVSIGGLPPADGLITGDDFNAYIAAFAASDPLADIVSIGGQPPPDGIVTGDDFNAFISSFALGCP